MPPAPCDPCELQRGRRPRTPESSHVVSSCRRHPQASTGPASEDAGETSAAWRTSRSTPASTGPASEDAGEPRAPCCGCVLVWASTGPASEDAGELRPGRRYCARGSCFNGAGVRGRRRALMSTVTRPPVGTLQRGRRPRTPERWVGRPVRLRHHDASTGPASEDAGESHHRPRSEGAARFNGAGVRGRRRLVLAHLPQRLPFASTGPASEDAGDSTTSQSSSASHTRLQRGRRPRTPESAGAAASARLRGRLQRGRRPRTPESTRRVGAHPDGSIASTGPASEDAGEVEAKSQRCSCQ